MRLTVSGDVSPDCTIADTGEPAGEQNGFPSYRWQNDAGTWLLRVTAIVSPTNRVWALSRESPEDGIGSWVKLGGLAIGNYAAVSGSIGTAVVSEYVPTTYAVLTINDGPLAGQYIVLRKS